MSVFINGDFQQAFVLFEQAWDCAPRPAMATLACTAACRARNADAARRYYARAPQAALPNLVQGCLRNDIEIE